MGWPVGAVTPMKGWQYTIRGWFTGTCHKTITGEGQHDSSGNDAGAHGMGIAVRTGSARKGDGFASELVEA